MNPFDRWKKPQAPAYTGDLTDPFRNDERNGTILPFAMKGDVPPPDFAKLLTPLEIEAAMELGKRCSKLVQDLSMKHPPGTVIPPHPLHVAVDFAVTAIECNIDLVRCLSVDDLLLTAEYVKIAKHHDRRKYKISSEARINLPLRSGGVVGRIVRGLNF